MLPHFDLKSILSITFSVVTWSFFVKYIGSSIYVVYNGSHILCKGQSVFLVASFSGCVREFGRVGITYLHQHTYSRIRFVGELDEFKRCHGTSKKSLAMLVRHLNWN